MCQCFLKPHKLKVLHHIDAEKLNLYLFAVLPTIVKYNLGDLNTLLRPVRVTFVL